MGFNCRNCQERAPRLLYRNQLLTKISAVMIQKFIAPDNLPTSIRFGEKSRSIQQCPFESSIVTEDTVVG